MEVVSFLDERKVLVAFLYKGVYIFRDAISVILMVIYMCIELGCDRG